MTSFNGALVIREQNGRTFYEAKWRDLRRSGSFGGEGHRGSWMTMAVQQR